MKETIDNKTDFHNYLMDKPFNIQDKIQNQVEASDYKPSVIIRASCRDIFSELQDENEFNDIELQLSEDDCIDTLVEMGF